MNDVAKAIRPGLIPVKKVVHPKRGHPFQMTYWVRMGTTLVRDPNRGIQATPKWGEYPHEIELPKVESLKDVPYLDWGAMEDLAGSELHHPSMFSAEMGVEGVLQFEKIMTFVLGQTMPLALDAMNSDTDIGTIWPAVVQGKVGQETENTWAGQRFINFFSYKMHNLVKPGEESRKKAMDWIEQPAGIIKAEGQKAIDDALRDVGINPVPDTERVSVGFEGTWGYGFQKSWANQSSDGGGPQDYLMQEAYNRLPDEVKAYTEGTKGQMLLGGTTPNEWRKNQLNEVYGGAGWDRTTKPSEIPHWAVQKKDQNGAWKTWTLYKTEKEADAGLTYNVEFEQALIASRTTSQKAAKVVYDSIKGRTQEFFADLGYKPDDEIMLFRGSEGDFFSRRNRFAERILNDPESVVPREEFTIRALSSWALDPGVCAAFSGQTGIILATKVKVKDIFSHFSTGFGCRTEQEVVLPADAFKNGVRIVYMGRGGELNLHNTLGVTEAPVNKAVYPGNMGFAEMYDLVRTAPSALASKFMNTVNLGKHQAAIKMLEDYHHIKFNPSIYGKYGKQLAPSKKDPTKRRWQLQSLEHSERAANWIRIVRDKRENAKGGKPERSGEKMKHVIIQKAYIETYYRTRKGKREKVMGHPRHVVMVPKQSEGQSVREKELRTNLQEANRLGGKLQLKKNPKFGQFKIVGGKDEDPFILHGTDPMGHDGIAIKGTAEFINKYVKEWTVPKAGESLSGYEGHHTLPVGMSIETIDWHLRHLGEGAKTIRDIDPEEHRKISAWQVKRQAEGKYGTRIGIGKEDFELSDAEKKKLKKKKGVDIKTTKRNIDEIMQRRVEQPKESYGDIKKWQDINEGLKEYGIKWKPENDMFLPTTSRFRVEIGGELHYFHSFKDFKQKVIEPIRAGKDIDLTSLTAEKPGSYVGLSQGISPEKLKELENKGYAIKKEGKVYSLESLKIDHIEKARMPFKFRMRKQELGSEEEKRAHEERAQTGEWTPSQERMSERAKQRREDYGE